MKKLIKIANFFAKYSTPLWCSNALVRGGCRAVYRWLAEGKFWYYRAMRQSHWVLSRRDIELAKKFPSVDTYPPLYADKAFAPWEEIADPEDPRRYNLISSRGGQVIRRSTSYCSWKIYELTGKYPERTIKKRFDARDWVEFLAAAGYTRIVNRPVSGHHYVGVMPDEGEFGQVIWFEKDDHGTGCTCSTYKNFEFTLTYLTYLRNNVTWVQID